MYTKEPSETQYSFTHNSFFLKPKLDEKDIFFKIAESINEAKNPIDLSALGGFRKTIGTEGVKLIEEEIFNVLKKNKLLKGKTLIPDITVVPSNIQYPISNIQYPISNIQYPTDINLLETVRKKAVQLIEQAKGFGAKICRTYKRKARQAYLRYQKLRKHTVRQRKNTQKKLIQFAGRNIKQLKETAKFLREKAAKTKQKTSETFSETIQKFLAIAENLLLQQKDIYHGIEVKERIVSIWATHIRPMVRGKYPIDVEFGPKILLNLKNKCLFLAGLYFNNVSDANLIVPAICEHQKLCGNYLKIK